MRKFVESQIWPLAVIFSFAAHLVIYNAHFFLTLVEKEKPVKVPVTVRVVPKNVPVRKGRLDGSFKPKPKKKKAVAKKKPKPKLKKNKIIDPSKKAAPKKEEPPVYDEANTLPDQEEIVGTSDEPFGSPDGTEDGVVGVQGEVDRSADPILIRSTFQLPEYTDDALDANFEGTVIVEVFVKPDGSVGDAEMRKKVGYGMDRRIIDSVLSSMFIPRKDAKGKSLEAWTDLPIRFVIP